MRQNNLLILLSSSASLALATAPRGVSPEDAKLYAASSENTFTCITHPSISIAHSQVNDDYCDCPDGSDEPGTSACAHLPHKNLSIPGFYCRNERHKSAYLPLSRVNDGICDYEICCDGSDEYAGVGGVKCENKCADIGKAARKLKAERERLRSDGMKKRAELIARAKALKKELEDDIKTTATTIEGIAKRVQGLEKTLKETEEKERLRMIKKPKEGSKVGTLISVARQRSEELRSTLERVKLERDSTIDKLLAAEKILAALKEGYNPNFNDEGVKTAVRAWEEYIAQQGTTQKPGEADDLILNNVMGEDPIDWDEFLEGDVEPVSLYSIEAFIPESIKPWVHEKLADFRQMLVDNGLLAPKPDSPANESKAVTAARDALRAGEKEEQDTRNHLKSLEEDLTKPYGTSNVFRPLKGECINADFGEYKYEFCFLGKATQKSLKDSSSTSLGDFTTFEYTSAAADGTSSHGLFETGWEEAHDEGLSGVVMKHENGQQCWNGPKRSVGVQLYCSAVNELRDVREEEKCVYRFEVGTPAVCGEGAEGETFEEKVRDEL